LSRLGSAARLKAASVNPYHYRKTRVCGSCRRPNVQIEAILTRPGIAEHHVFINPPLHAASSKLSRFPNSSPRLRRLWWPPPQISNGRRSKRNPLECPDPINSSSTLDDARLRSNLVSRRTDCNWQEHQCENRVSRSHLIKISLEQFRGHPPAGGAQRTQWQTQTLMTRDWQRNSGFRVAAFDTGSSPSR